MEDKQRTIRQNKSLWKFYEMLAQELNDAGLDMKKTLKPWVDIPWSKQTVHDFLWVPIMKLQLGKRSTTEMTTKDVQEIYETLTRYMAEKHGLATQWPSLDSLLAEKDV